MEDESLTAWIDLEPGESFIRFGDLAYRLAKAVHPVPVEDEDFDFHFGCALIEYERELKSAVRAGAIVPRNPLTRGKHSFPIGAALDDSIISIAEVRTFALERGIGLRIAPKVKQCAPELKFSKPARPTEMPPALLELPDEQTILLEDSDEAGSSTRPTTAGHYKKELECIIARQATGYYTLSEAARVLAESSQGINPADCVRRFRLAHSRGELRIHHGGSRFPLEVGETVRDFWDTVNVGELDAWLRAAVGHGFPVAAAATAPSALALPMETPKQRRVRLLQMHDAEVAAGRAHGALERITKIEKRTRPTADRSNIGKQLKQARKERDEERRGGALTRLLVR